MAQHRPPAYLVGEEHCCVDNRSSKQGDFEVEHFVCGDKKGAGGKTLSLYGTAEMGSWADL